MSRLAKIMKEIRETNVMGSCVNILCANKDNFLFFLWWSSTEYMWEQHYWWVLNHNTDVDESHLSLPCHAHARVRCILTYICKAATDL